MNDILEGRKIIACVTLEGGLRNNCKTHERQIPFIIRLVLHKSAALISTQCKQFLIHLGGGGGNKASQPLELYKDENYEIAHERG